MVEPVIYVNANVDGEAAKECGVPQGSGGGGSEIGSRMPPDSTSPDNSLPWQTFSRPTEKKMLTFNSRIG